MTTARRVALAAVLTAVLAAVLAGAALGTCLVLHERARTAWALTSAQLGAPGYSAARSDALYREVDVLRARARVAAWASAIAAALLSSALGAARGPRSGARRDATRARLVATTSLDAAATLATLATALGVRGLRTGSPALDDTLAVALPALVVSACLWVAARGETPGTLVTRVEHGSWSAARAPIVVLALPLALGLPLTWLAALAGRATRPGLFAPHLSVVGALHGASR